MRGELRKRALLLAATASRSPIELPWACSAVRPSCGSRPAAIESLPNALSFDRSTDMKPATASTTANDPLRSHEMVLLALARAADWTTKKVSYEDIVLQAWRDFPQAFSLRNHPEHPDASDIHKRIYQTLKPSGLVVSLGNKVFRLTDEGIERAQEFSATVGTVRHKHSSKPRLARDEQNFIERALASRAFSTWKSGESDKLIDYDARMFFQFSTGTPVADRNIRVDFAMRSIEKARQIGMADVQDLMMLANYLATRFADLLTEQ